MHLSTIVLVCLVAIVNTRPRYRILSNDREIYINLANPPIDFNPMYSKEERQGECPAYKPRICTGRSMAASVCQYDDDCLHHSKCCKDYCYRYKVCIRVQMPVVTTTEATTTNLPHRTTWSEDNEIPTGDLDEKQTESPQDYAGEDDYYYVDLDDFLTLPPQFTTEEEGTTTEEDDYTENETTIEVAFTASEETTTEEIETTTLEETTIEETETTPEETTTEEIETTTPEETTIEETETTPEETTTEEIETTTSEETTIEETETTPEQTTTEETDTTTPEETTTEETVETTAATTVEAGTEEATEETESEEEYEDYTTTPDEGSGSGDDEINDNEDDYDESEYVSNESEEDAGKLRVEKETDGLNVNKSRRDETVSTANAEETGTEIYFQNVPFHPATLSGKDEAVEPNDVIENGTAISEVAKSEDTVAKFETSTIATTTYRVETTTVDIVEEGSGSGDKTDDTEDDYDEEEDADNPMVEKETEMNKSVQNAKSSKDVSKEAEYFDYDSETDEAVERNDSIENGTAIEVAQSEVDTENGIEHEIEQEKEIQPNESVDEVEANTTTYQVHLEQDVELSQTVAPQKQLDVEVEKVLLQNNTEPKQVVEFAEPSNVSEESDEDIDSDWRTYNASDEKEHNQSSKNNDAVVEIVPKEKVDVLDNEEPVHLSVPLLENQTVRNKIESVSELGINEELTTERVKEKVEDVVTRMIDLQEATTARAGLLTTWLVLGGTEEKGDGGMSKAVTNNEEVAETTEADGTVEAEIEKTKVMDYDSYEIEELDETGKEQAEDEDEKSRQGTGDEKKRIKLEKGEKKTVDKDKKKTEKKGEKKTEKEDDKRTGKKDEKKTDKKTSKNGEKKTEKKDDKKTDKKNDKKTEKKDEQQTEKENKKKMEKKSNKKLEETDKKTMGKKQKGTDELEEIDIDEATEKVKSKPKKVPEEEINRNEDEASGSGSGDGDAIPDDYGDDYEEQFSGDKANP